MQETSRKYTLAALLILVGFLLFLFLENAYVKNFLDIAWAFIKVPASAAESANGRTNILIMGTAGSGYAGGDLTDTMILASLSLKNPSLTLISIPRDLWIPQIRAKVNSAYHYGGIPLAKESVARVLGKPIQYGMVIDFSGFKDIVDVLGGIKVNVERGFTDPQYPIAGKENDTCSGDRQFKCRYETVSFSEGEQMMDGTVALKFVRSRHAEGTEGTDTAREARQQKVISAIKNKLLSLGVILNPWKDIQLYELAKTLIQTDVNGETGAVLARKALTAHKSISQHLIPQDLLVNPPINSLYDGQYVFIPKLGSGNWKGVSSWFESILP